LIGYGLTSH